MDVEGAVLPIIRLSEPTAKNPRNLLRLGLCLHAKRPEPHEVPQNSNRSPNCTCRSRAWLVPAAVYAPNGSTFSPSVATVAAS